MHDLLVVMHLLRMLKHQTSFPQNKTTKQTKYKIGVNSDAICFLFIPSIESEIYSVNDFLLASNLFQLQMIHQTVRVEKRPSKTVRFFFLKFEWQRISSHEFLIYI